jgi:2,3-bisphosphoglycerate-independent phosphoglycerate mutase
MPSFSSRFGLDAALNSAVDLVRGLGVLTDIEVVDVEGMTAGYDTDYAAQRECALDSLADGADLFVVHVEATDEAGHAGDVDEKVTALERWDRLILTDLVAGLGKLGPWRLLFLPDHATPLALRTHTSAPVPYLLVGSDLDAPGGVYTERGVAGAPVRPGHELVGRLVAG